MKQTSCIIVLTLLKVVLPVSENYEYILQINPITIASSPKSQVVYSEDNFILTCVANLSSKSKVVVDWMFNNKDIDRIHSTSSRSFNSITSSLHRDNASQNDSGYYECLILDGVDPLGNSTMVTVSEKAYIRVVGHHLKDKATKIFNVTLGDQVTLSCDLNLRNYSDVVWFKDGWQAPSLNVHASGALEITDMSIEDEGVYYCSSSLAVDQLTSTLFINHNSIVRPQISDISRVTEMYTFLNETRLDLVCQVIDNGSRLIYSWYKNGVELTGHANADNELTYVPNSPGAGAMAGIYQCFVHSVAGSDSSITRVLERGFSNPPDNISCISVDQSNHPELPKIVLNWDSPILNTNTITRYTLEYKGQKFTTNTTTFEINLDDDSFSVHIYVFVSNQYSNQSKSGVRGICSLSDTAGRRTSPANARRLKVTCPSSITGGRIEWNNPGFLSAATGVIAYVEHYHLQCVCLYNKSVEVCADYTDSNLPFETKSVEVEVDKMVPGSICLFGGEYSFLSVTPILKIPLEICAVPPVYSDTRLNVTCGETGIILHISWKSFDDNSIGIHMEGNCLKDNFDAEFVIYDIEVSSPTSELNINNGSANFNVCSFTMEIRESSGNSTYDLQCALEGVFFTQPVLQNETMTDSLEEYDTTSELPQFNTTTSIENTTSELPQFNTITSTENTTSELSQFNTTSIESSAYRMYMIVLSLCTATAAVAFIAIMIMMLVCYRKRSKRNNWYNHGLTSGLTGELNVAEIVKVDCTDTTSLKSDVTVLDFLKKEKQLHLEDLCSTDLQTSHYEDTLWLSDIPADSDEHGREPGVCYEATGYTSSGIERPSPVTVAS